MFVYSRIVIPRPLLLGLTNLDVYMSVEKRRTGEEESDVFLGSGTD